MANRTPVSATLKLSVSYVNEKGESKIRNTTFSKLKPNSDAAAISETAAAFGTLQNDPISNVYEIVENEISA